MAERTMIEAINLALHQEMERDDTVLVLGEDVGVDGGVFRVTDGLIDEFGAERICDAGGVEARVEIRKPDHAHRPGEHENRPGDEERCGNQIKDQRENIHRSSSRSTARRKAIWARATSSER